MLLEMLQNASQARRKAKKIVWIAVPFIIIVICFLCVMMNARFSNRQIVDVHYRFDRAVLSLPNGKIIEGPVDSWKDFEDGDQLQVTIQGVTYLVHSANCVLIDE